jgi:MFS family permease
MSELPVVTTELRDKLSLSSAQIGLLTSVFMVMFAIGAIPMGLAFARWGGRVVLIGVGVLALGSVLFALSSSYPLFVLGRVLQGIGGASVIPVSNPLLSQAISVRFHARCMGIWGVGYGLGVVAGFLILSNVDSAAGYRGVFLVGAGIAALIGVVNALQKPVLARPTGGAPPLKQLLRLVGSVATNRRILLLCVINIGCMAIIAGALAWTPPFFHDQRGASLAIAAYLTAGVGVAQLIGNPVGAGLMARWGKPFVLFISMAIMFVATVLVPFASGLAAPFVCVTIAGFVSMVIFPAIWGSVPDIVRRPEEIGVGSGFLNLTNLVATLFAPWMFGVLLDAYGKTGPDAHGYTWGYLLLALFTLLGAIAGAVYLATRRKRLLPLAGVGGEPALAVEATTSPDT